MAPMPAEAPVISAVHLESMLTIAPFKERY
jgi:hypothetical protein